MELGQKDEPKVLFQSSLDNAPTSRSWAMHLLLQVNDGWAIVAAISNHMAIAICDGSFKEEWGAVAFILEGPSSEGHVVGANVTPGASWVQSPYHSKLGRIYGVVCMVKMVVSIFGISQGSITLRSDYTEALAHFFTS